MITISRTRTKYEQKRFNFQETELNKNENSFVASLIAALVILSYHLHPGYSTVIALWQQYVWVKTAIYIYIYTQALNTDRYKVLLVVVPFLLVLLVNKNITYAAHKRPTFYLQTLQFSWHLQPGLWPSCGTKPVGRQRSWLIITAWWQHAVPSQEQCSVFYADYWASDL